jgi:hypothetical protein
MARTSALTTTLAGMMLLTACAAPPAATDTSAATPKNIRIEYIHPEKFTDVGDRDFPRDSLRNEYLGQLRKHLAQGAARLLPAEQQLTVSITDIDMAGNFEPWRIRLYDTRIIRDVYPPRIDLRFALTAADGTPLREGERQLRNPAFLMTMQPYFRNDPLRYEKALLDDWLDRELSERRK